MVESMQKILETEDPLIRCYPHHASLFSGLMSNDFELNEILPSYIQIVYNKDIQRCDFNYGMDILNYIKNYPYSESYCYKRDIIKKSWKAYSEFIIDMINQSCYVHLLVDTFYVSAYKNWYKKYHEIHNITVYGYDDEYFYVADMFEKGKFSFSKVPKRELDESELSDKEYDWLEGVHCWRLREKMYSCIVINPVLVKKGINSYLQSRKTEACTCLESIRRGNRGEPFVYGIRIYDEIKQYVLEEKEDLDVRIPYVFIEQKKILMYIIGILEKQYRLQLYEEQKNNIDRLTEQNVIIQNLFIKYNLLKKDSIKDKIIAQIDMAKKKEIEYLTRLCDNISIKSRFEKKENKYTEGVNEYVVDKITQGSWKNNYGKKGLYIIGDKIVLSDDIKVYDNKCFYVSLLRNKADQRGLQRYSDNNDYRLAAYYLNNKEFNLEIRIKEKTKITFYIVDYDKLERKQKVYVQSKSTGEVIVEFLVEKFENGIYISFFVNEDIIITFERVSGPDAVLSGIFFD